MSLNAVKRFMGFSSGAPKRLANLSVVIPTLGREILKESLDRLTAGNSWPGHLIVVDQGMNPQVERWLARLNRAGMRTDYVPCRQHGRAAGINRGLDRVTSRFVAITDDDCFVAPDWLETMHGWLCRHPSAIITGRVEPAGDGEVPFCVVTAERPAIYRRPALKVHPLIGGNMGASMATVRRIGRFDEHPSLGSAEDSDWGYRALRVGIPIYYRPEIVVSHYSWRDGVQRAARYRQYSRSQGGFYGKYLFNGGWLIPAQAARDLVRGPVRWLRGKIRRDADMIDRGRADTLEMLPGIIAGLRRRGGRQSNPGHSFAHHLDGR